VSSPIALPETRAALADPADPKTFESCRLDLGERTKNTESYALHRDLLKLRRTDPVFSAPRPRGIDGAVLGASAFVLRFFASNGADRLLLVNLGCDLRLAAAPEPLLAPPENRHWSLLWSSDDLRYGGCGTPAIETDGAWRIPGEAAIVMSSVACER
jgi:maltooligosyltrehalose trehalohydrolase